MVWQRDGSALEPVLRVAVLLNVPQKLVDFVFASFFLLFGSFVSSVVELCMSSMAGEGLHFSAWQGVYYGVPFIIKIPHSQDAAGNKWTALTSLLPHNPTIASCLPITTYFGLFRSGTMELILTSDNGVALNQLVEGFEDLQ